MKSAFLTVLFVCCSFSSAFASGEDRQKVKPDFSVEMDGYMINAENVESVDIFVDYQMIPVKCYGPESRYSVLTNTKTREIIVTKAALAHVGLPCRPTVRPQSMQQNGVKITVRAKEGMSSLDRKLLVPAGATVEVIEHKISAD